MIVGDFGFNDMHVESVVQFLRNSSLGGCLVSNNANYGVARVAR